jgi:hypothetical protein
MQHVFNFFLDDPWALPHLPICGVYFLELLQLDVVCVHTTMGFMGDKPSPS